MHSRIWLLTMVAAIAAAGSPQTTSDAPAPVKIVKKTQLVYVPVVVNDKHGKHIAGLTKDLFKIEQDGKQQEIGVFEEVTKSEAVAKAKPTFPEGSGYVENYVSPNGETRKLMIMVLDTLNTPFFGQSEARYQLMKYLGKSLQADVPIALMVLNSNGLRQVHAFTSDTTQLIDAVQKFGSRKKGDKKEGFEVAMGDNRHATADDEINDLEGDFGTAHYERYLQMNAARTTIQALEQLAGAYQGIPGRKTVVWATGGFPFALSDPQSLGGLGFDFVEDYKRAFDQLNNANMAIYAVDVNGLVGPRFTSARGPGSYNLTQQKQDSLRAISDSTGGKAFLNDNDFNKAFEEAAEDGAAYYVVGYYLKSDAKPGWHKLKIRVNTAHAEVRAKEGFLIPSPEKQTKESRILQLGVATLSPADYTALHFGMLVEKPNLDPADKSTSKRMLPFHLSFPPGSLTVDGDENNLVSVDVFAVALMKQDKEAGERISGVRTHLKPQSFAEFQKSGMGFEERIELPPGAYDFRVAVRDNNTGHIGTVRTNIVVP